MIILEMMIVSALVLAGLMVYEIKIYRMRNTVIILTSELKREELTRISHSSSTAMLSLAAIVFSVWSGFVLLADTVTKQSFGEDIAFILALSLAGIACFTISSYLHHLTSYVEFAKDAQYEDTRLRMQIYHTASTFFTTGTVFLLLSFLFSFIMILTLLQVPFSSTSFILILTIGPLLLLLTLAAFRLRGHVAKLPRDSKPVTRAPSSAFRAHTHARPIEGEARRQGPAADRGQARPAPPVHVHTRLPLPGARL